MATNGLTRLMQTKAPQLTRFDNLYSEYLTFEAQDIAKLSAEAKAKIDDIVAKRAREDIDWSDIYLFELILADVQPRGTLRGKIVTLRHDYRSIAGQAEYDEYLASRPKDLLDPPDPNAPPDAHANYEKLLREDLKDLLGRLYLRYATLPVRELKLKSLTVRASLLCGAFLAVLLLFIIVMVIQRNVGAEGRGWYIPSLSIFVVLSAGAMGGFLSALQRIQTSPVQGDLIYNLSLLYHGSYAVFVAPLTGAIFAVLLYLMFTGGILEGRFFPKMYTPSLAANRAAAAAAANANTNTNTNVNSNQNAAGGATNANSSNAATNANSGNAATANANSANANSTNVNSAAVTSANANLGNSNANAGRNGNTNSADGNANANLNANGNGNRNGGAGGDNRARSNVNGRAPATGRPEPAESISIQRFLADSGPANGADYALLIIWCFIAGFAERFVPDALNRLVATRQVDDQLNS